MGWGGTSLRVGLLLLVGAGCTTIEDRLSTAATPTEIARQTADYYVHDAKDESCSVAIVSPSGSVYANAGSASERSLYRLASLSKLFLHPVLLKLHAEGRINLDRPVTAYSKMNLPPEYGTVTLRDLLENRSGMPREFLVHWEPFDMWTCFHCGFTGIHIYDRFDSREDFERMTWRPWWRHAVLAKREIYSNMGFGLLGAVVEDALGTTLEDLAQAELVQVKGFDDTTYEPERKHAARMTRACAGQLPWLVRRGHDVPDHRLGSALRATGGLFSSATDCARAFSDYWRIIDEEMKERSLDAYADDAVFGLLRVKQLASGRRVLYRSGMIYGGASFVGFDPQARTIVVILRNVTSWPDRRGFAVMEKVAAGAPPAPSFVAR